MTGPVLLPRLHGRQCARFWAGGFFGFEFVGESHHIIKTIVRGEYFTGAIRAIGAVALVVIGAWLLRRARHDFQLEVAAPANS